MNRAERTQSSLKSAGCGDPRAELPLAESWPPPPHDPRERDLVVSVRGWEVRVFGEHKFQYFVRHSFWHLQLWQPVARVSVLTPSRLTCELYEVFPVAGWKGRASKSQELAQIVQDEHGLELPYEMELLELEGALVQRVKTRFQRLS